MEKRKLGNTDLYVSRLGVGLAEIGHLSVGDEERVRRLLYMALDNGITFLDTAACYGNSEVLVGRTVAGRRAEFTLATKAGHASDAIASPDWTAETVTASIERSLGRLQTDYLDLVQLHSCDVDVLERGEVIQALLDAKRAGKTRYIGYSGDNEAARWALESNQFDTLQTSYNLLDQRARTYLFPQAEASRMGIIAKRPIANAAWGATRTPSGYAAEYYRRYQVMSEGGPIPGAPENRILLALGFALAEARVDVAIVGTSDPEHMRSNIQWVENELPLDAGAVRALQQRFEVAEQDWTQRG